MIQQIINQLSKLNYTTYTNPFQLNIVGIRCAIKKTNSFNDVLIIFYKDEKDAWQFHSFKATTWPGLYWLQHPLSKLGTAILKPNQYKDAYAIGLHRSKYTALVQIKPVAVIRDNNKDAILNTNTLIEQTGMFGINIHHANTIGTTSVVNKYSAGCQVLANITEFNVLMELAKKHKVLYGNSFTYTLIDEQV
jgi:hypothetical protein